MTFGRGALRQVVSGEVLQITLHIYWYKCSRPPIVSARQCRNAEITNDTAAHAEHAGHDECAGDAGAFAERANHRHPTPREMLPDSVSGSVTGESKLRRRAREFSRFSTSRGPIPRKFSLVQRAGHTQSNADSAVTVIPIHIYLHMSFVSRGIDFSR